MSATQLRRDCTAALALTSLAWGQACTSYQRVQPGRLAPGSEARVVSARPFLVPAGLTPGRVGEPCRVTLAQGVVGTAAGDTLAFERLTRVLRVDRGDRGCAARGQPTVVVRPEDAQLNVRRFSAGRTAALVLGVAAVAVGLMAYAASTIEYNYDSGSSW
jgi:hypothetical protein